jgi:hypothetical protein
MTASKGTMLGRDQVKRKYFDTRISRLARPDLATEFDNWRDVPYGDFIWMLVEEQGSAGTDLVLGKPLTGMEGLRLFHEVCHKGWKGPIRVASAVNAPEAYAVSFEIDDVPILFSMLSKTAESMQYLYHVTFADRMEKDFAASASMDEELLLPMDENVVISGIETAGKLLFSPSEEDANVIAEALSRALGRDPDDAIVLRVDRKHVGEVFDTAGGTSWSYSPIPTFRLEARHEGGWLPLALPPADFKEERPEMPKTLTQRVWDLLEPRH